VCIIYIAILARKVKVTEFSNSQRILLTLSLQRRQWVFLMWLWDFPNVAVQQNPTHSWVFQNVVIAALGMLRYDATYKAYLHLRTLCRRSYWNVFYSLSLHCKRLITISTPLDGLLAFGIKFQHCSLHRGSSFIATKCFLFRSLCFHS